MTSIFARRALLTDGWCDHVRLVIEQDRIARIVRDAKSAKGDVLAGIVIPGLTNAHSHAFQRALAGRTEQRSPESQDNFWTWRDRMYRLAARIDASTLLAVARQLYAEMLAAGYTAVAEFHYLHNEPGSATPCEAMFEALVTAANDVGMRLTYVPVLYERAGFNEQEPTAEQRRFATTLDAFEAHYRRARTMASATVTVGIGAHSLRAVSERSLRRIVDLAAADAVPMHLHIAEQQREVDQSLAALDARPVRWLMHKFKLDERWCLVHATHIDEEETAALARSGAIVCLCPSTEANLGDGLFPLESFLEHGGRIAIGSDSHVSLNPFEELRWLEYGQRLVWNRRNIAAIGDSQSGRSLFERAVSGGALAAGRKSGALATGNHADLVVLDDDDPMLVGHSADSLLDALVFSGYRLPVERVMTGGRWQVIDGLHVARDRARVAYANAIRQLFPPGEPGA
ncbi:MAG: formimidoylglutamate deiminase [Woeseia sp.]